MISIAFVLHEIVPLFSSFHKFIKSNMRFTLNMDCDIQDDFIGPH